MILKVDFKKAYDYVSWSFLRYMLKMLGFSSKWSLWMEVCVFETYFSVLVNESSTKDFNGMKSLRGGNSLSPFPFSIVVE